MSRLTSFTFDRALAALVFLAIALACALTPMQTDTWWQLLPLIFVVWANVCLTREIRHRNCETQHEVIH